MLHRAHFLKLLKELFLQYPVTAKYEHDDSEIHQLYLLDPVHRVLTLNILCRCEDDGKPMAKSYKFSNQRLRNLGLDFTPLKESSYETVMCLQKKVTSLYLLP